MKFALFECCINAMGLNHYTSSIRAVLNSLGIEYHDVKEFNCCGYPLRNFSFKAFLLAAVRDLALAERRALDILTLCNCCYGNLKHAEHLMKEESALRDEINATLAKEGLHYERGIGTKHVLQVLHDDLSIDHLRANLKKRFRGLKIATHYGCHILRPSKITQFDHPFMPTKLDQLVAVTGAESIPWLTKLECCGSPLTGVNDELSMDLAQKKLAHAKEAGADYVCVSCPFCQMQFDRVQKMVLSHRGSKVFLPSILYIQLLGLCLDIDPKELGLEMNPLLFSGIQQFLSEN